MWGGVELYYLPLSTGAAEGSSADDSTDVEALDSGEEARLLRLEEELLRSSEDSGY